MQLRHAVITFTLLTGPAALAAAPTDADRSFLMDEGQGAQYEIAIAKLAATKATKPAIRTYAKKIVADHAQANPALMKLTKAEGVAVPPGLASADQAKLDKLKGLSGTDFDKMYVDEITRINADDEKSFAKESKNTQVPQIKAYVQKFASMDARHKQMGEALK
ncbi:MAG: DUF4142 domain-containing protein [Pseudomonadota bacterium]|nr:DUF4142 domain-containing protein [Pseudomonadota bacterium]